MNYVMSGSGSGEKKPKLSDRVMKFFGKMIIWMFSVGFIVGYVTVVLLSILVPLLITVALGVAAYRYLFWGHL